MSTGDLSPSSSLSPSVTPHANLANQVPKFGTVIPNRIFVGGISGNTTDQELKVFFATYGAVKETKIICDRAGVSKGYGFVTFETQEDAEKIIKKESENLIFKDRKLNIGPAIRKQQAFPRLLDGSVTASPTILMTPNGYSYAQPVVPVLPGVDVNNYQALQQQVQQVPSNYSTAMMIPQQIYMAPTHYQYSSTPIQTQAAQAVQYANQQWLSARSYQPPAVTVAGSSYLYSVPDLVYGNPATGGVAAQQILELTESTMRDQSATEPETRANVAASSSKECNLSIDATQSMAATLMPMHSRPQVSIHSYHTSPNGCAQPPPVKKMTPMPTHIPNSTSTMQYGQRCYPAQPLVVKSAAVSKPAVLTNQAQRIPGVTMAYLASNFDPDGHLAANIAPPTPPSTPATAPGSLM